MRHVSFRGTTSEVHLTIRMCYFFRRSLETFLHVASGVDKASTMTMTQPEYICRLSLIAGGDLCKRVVEASGILGTGPAGHMDRSDWEPG